MTNPSHPPGEDERLNRIVARTIESQVGPADCLPNEVVETLFEVYRAFLPAYIEMVRMRDHRPESWQPREMVIEPEVLAGLSHFFSDYQHIARRFIRINRQVSRLKKLDPVADARRFEACVKEIVSASQAPPILESLVGS